MITVGLLRAKGYVERDVPPHGQCLVVKAQDFLALWRSDLAKQGHECVNFNLNGEVVLVKLSINSELMKQANTVQPVVLKKAIEKRAEGGNLWLKVWKPEEDELLIALWERKPKLTVAKIAVEFCAKFPERSAGAMGNRVSALQQEGRIQPRFTHKRKAKPEAKKEDAAATLDVLKVLEKLTKDVDGIMDVLDIQNHVIDKLLCQVLMQTLQVKEHLGELAIPKGLWVHYANAILEDDKKFREGFREKVKKLLEVSK